MGDIHWLVTHNTAFRCTQGSPRSLVHIYLSADLTPMSLPTAKA